MSSMHNQMTHDYDWDIVANILVIDAKFLCSMGFLLQASEIIRLCKRRIG